MEDLIVLLIHGIIKLFGNRTQPPQRRPGTTPPPGWPTAPGQPARPGTVQPQPLRRSTPGATVRPQGGVQRRGAVRRPVPPTMAALAAPIITSRPAPQGARPAAARPATATATKPSLPAATNIRRWLTPVALRQQIILSEILRPPVSMREDR